MGTVIQFDRTRKASFLWSPNGKVSASWRLNTNTGQVIDMVPRVRHIQAIAEDNNRAIRQQVTRKTKRKRKIDKLMDEFVFRNAEGAVK